MISKINTLYKVLAVGVAALVCLTAVNSVQAATCGSAQMLTASINGKGNIFFKWSAVPNAITYTLEITANGQPASNDNPPLRSISLPASQNFYDLTFKDLALLGAKYVWSVTAQCCADRCDNFVSDFSQQDKDLIKNQGLCVFLKPLYDGADPRFCKDGKTAYRGSDDAKYFRFKYSDGSYSRLFDPTKILSGCAWDCCAFTNCETTQTCGFDFNLRCAKNQGDQGVGAHEALIAAPTKELTYALCAYNNGINEIFGAEADKFAQPAKPAIKLDSQGRGYWEWQCGVQSCKAYRRAECGDQHGGFVDNSSQLPSADKLCKKNGEKTGQPENIQVGNGLMTWDCVGDGPNNKNYYYVLGGVTGNYWQQLEHCSLTIKQCGEAQDQVITAATAADKKDDDRFFCSSGRLLTGPTLSSSYVNLSNKYQSRYTWSCVYNDPQTIGGLTVVTQTKNCFAHHLDCFQAAQSDINKFKYNLAKTSFEQIGLSSGALIDKFCNNGYSWQMADGDRVVLDPNNTADMNRGDKWQWRCVDRHGGQELCEAKQTVCVDLGDRYYSRAQLESMTGQLCLNGEFDQKTGFSIDKDQLVYNCLDSFSVPVTCSVKHNTCGKPPHQDGYANWNEFITKNSLNCKGDGDSRDCSGLCADRTVSVKVAVNDGRWSWQCGQDSCFADKLACADKLKEAYYFSWDELLAAAQRNNPQASWVGSGNTRQIVGLCNNSNSQVSVTFTEATGRFAWKCGDDICVGLRPGCGVAAGKLLEQAPTKSEELCLNGGQVKWDNGDNGFIKYAINEWGTSLCSPEDIAKGRGFCDYFDKRYREGAWFWRCAYTIDQVETLVPKTVKNKHKNDQYIIDGKYYYKEKISGGSYEYSVQCLATEKPACAKVAVGSTEEFLRARANDFAKRGNGSLCERGIVDTAFQDTLKKDDLSIDFKDGIGCGGGKCYYFCNPGLGDYGAAEYSNVECAVAMSAQCRKEVSEGYFKDWQEFIASAPGISCSGNSEQEKNCTGVCENRDQVAKVALSSDGLFKWSCEPNKTSDAANWWQFFNLNVKNKNVQCSGVDGKSLQTENDFLSYDQAWAQCSGLCGDKLVRVNRATGASRGFTWNCADCAAYLIGCGKALENEPISDVNQLLTNQGNIACLNGGQPRWFKFEDANEGGLWKSLNDYRSDQWSEVYGGYRSNGQLIGQIPFGLNDFATGESGEATINAGRWLWKCAYERSGYENPLIIGAGNNGKGFSIPEISSDRYCSTRILAKCKDFGSNPTAVTLDQLKTMTFDDDQLQNQEATRGYDQLCAYGVVRKWSVPPTSFNFAGQEKIDNPQIFADAFYCDRNSKICYWQCLTHDAVSGLALPIKQTGNSKYICALPYNGCSDPSGQVLADADFAKHGNIRDNGGLQAKCDDGTWAAVTTQANAWLWSCGGDQCSTKRLQCSEPPHRSTVTVSAWYDLYNPTTCANAEYGESACQPLCLNNLTAQALEIKNGRYQWTCGGDQCFANRSCDTNSLELEVKRTPTGLICSGNDATLSATVKNCIGGNLTYAWTVNNKAIDDRDNVVTLTELKTKTAWSLKVVCKIEGCADRSINTDSTISVSENKTPKVVISGDTEVCFGKATQLTATVENCNKVTSVKWLDAAGQVVDNDQQLTLENLQQSGNYTAVATCSTDNDCLTIPTAEAGVAITVKPLPDEPVIIDQPIDQIGKCAKEDYGFSIQASCAIGSLSVNWFKQGTTFAIKNNSLTLSKEDIGLNGAGDYYAQIVCKNDCGEKLINSRTAKLVFEAEPNQPDKIDVNFSGSKCLLEPYDHSLTVDVDCKNGERVALQWRRQSLSGDNDSLLKQAESGANDYSGALSSQLNRDDLQTQSGRYYVRAKCMKRCADSEWLDGDITELVFVEPGQVSDVKISDYNQSVCRGTALTLQASAVLKNNCQSVKYQWSVLSGSADLGDAESSAVTLNNIQPDETGKIKIKVSGWCEGDCANSAKVSDEMVLTVVPDLSATFIKEPVGKNDLCIGSQHNLTATAKCSDNQTPTYQWYKDGSVINGATAPDYAATASGQYYVKATCRNNCGEKSVDSSPVNVQVVEKDKAEAATLKAEPDPVCDGEQITLSGQGQFSANCNAWEYRWGGTGAWSRGELNFMTSKNYTAQTGQTYQFEIRCVGSTKNCYDSSQVREAKLTPLVLPKKTPDFNLTINGLDQGKVCSNQNLSLSVNDLQNCNQPQYQWWLKRNNDDYQPIDGGSLSVKQSGTYGVKLTVTCQAGPDFCLATPTVTKEQSFTVLDCACGTADKKTYTTDTVFADQRCLTGGSVTGFNSTENGWTWRCQYPGPVIIEGCSATKLICGSANNKNYIGNIKDSDTFCSLPGKQNSFSSVSQSLSKYYSLQTGWKWLCQGDGGPDDNIQCSANKVDCGYASAEQTLAKRTGENKRIMPYRGEGGTDVYYGSFDSTNDTFLLNNRCTVSAAAGDVINSRRGLLLWTCKDSDQQEINCSARYDCGWLETANGLYPTVRVGIDDNWTNDQCWTAENVQAKDDNNSKVTDMYVSWAAGIAKDNWNSTSASLGKWRHANFNSSGNISGVCASTESSRPWKIPSKSDWDRLLTYVHQGQNCDESRLNTENSNGAEWACAGAGADSTGLYTASSIGLRDQRGFNAKANENYWTRSTTFRNKDNGGVLCSVQAGNNYRCSSSGYLEVNKFFCSRSPYYYGFNSTNKVAILSDYAKSNNQPNFCDTTWPPTNSAAYGGEVKHQLRCLYSAVLSQGSVKNPCINPLATNYRASACLLYRLRVKTNPNYPIPAFK